MKAARFVLCAILVFCWSPVLPAAEETQKDKPKVDAAEPYRPEEFPQWARDLRRAEVIAFGAFPFAMFISKTTVDSFRYAQHDWDRSYAPWPLKTAGATAMTEDEYKRTFTAACVGALTVALVDFIIVKIKRHGERKAISERPKASYTIERSGPPSADPIPADSNLAPGEEER